MDNAPQLPHRPAPPVGTEWNTEFRRIQLKITKNTTMITDGLEMAWESLWKVRGDVGGRVEGKKKWYMCDYTGNRTRAFISRSVLGPPSLPRRGRRYSPPPNSGCVKQQMMPCLAGRSFRRFFCQFCCLPEEKTSKRTHILLHDAVSVVLATEQSWVFIVPTGPKVMFCQSPFLFDRKVVELLTI